MLPSGDLVSWGLRSLHHLILGTWLGSWILFAFAVAPTAFRVLPSSQLAGQVVGPILDTLHQGGVVAGLALALLATLERQGGIRIALPLGLAAVCAGSQFGVTAAIDAIQPEAFGAAASAEAAARFSDLHQLSRALYFITGAGLVVLTVLSTRSSGPGDSPRDPLPGPDENPPTGDEFS